MTLSTEGSWSPDVYAQLRQMADAMMARERQDHTLGPTALTHEVWLRLLQSHNAATLDHGAFLGLAAQALRRILTDHARRKASAKHGGAARRTTLADKALPTEPETFALDLDAALSALNQTDPELARIVELSFYAELSTAEIAELLKVSTRTIKRRWRFARAWLQHYMLENQS